MTPDAAAPMPWRRRARWLVIGLPLALAIVPPALLARAMVRDTVEFPWMDQWTFAREVVRAYDGELGAGDLWAQHNEHRVPVPKLVLHVLAAASGWDVRWEVAANFVVALAMIVLVASTIRRTVGPVAPLAVGLLVLAASALQSSLVQWQNWTWGWQFGLLLACAGALAVAAVLERAPSAPARWAAVAMLTAVAAALSNGAGLVLLATVPLGLLLLRAAGARIPFGVVLACLGLGAATAGLYAVGWVRAFGQPKATPILGNEAALIRYALTFLGGPIVSWDAALAWRWGVAGIGTVLVSAAVVWVSAPAQRPALVPWLALAAFSTGAAALTAVGRMRAGGNTALLSRYATFAVPLWLAVGPVVTIAIATRPGRVMRWALIVAAIPALGLAVSQGRQSWVRGDQRMSVRAAVVRGAARCISDPAKAPDACYRTVCWNAQFARRSAMELQAHRLGPWARRPE